MELMQVYLVTSRRESAFFVAEARLRILAGGGVEIAYVEDSGFGMELCSPEIRLSRVIGRSKERVIHFDRRIRPDVCVAFDNVPVTLDYPVEGPTAGGNRICRCGDSPGRRRVFLALGSVE
jgi:hypothetical protein